MKWLDVLKAVLKHGLGGFRTLGGDGRRVKRGHGYCRRPAIRGPVFRYRITD